MSEAGRLHSAGLGALFAVRQPLSESQRLLQGLGKSVDSNLGSGVLLKTSKESFSVVF